jgi:hypothetical protein
LKLAPSSRGSLLSGQNCNPRIHVYKTFLRDDSDSAKWRVMKKDGFSSGGQQKLECNCPNEQQQVESKNSSRIYFQGCQTSLQKIRSKCSYFFVKKYVIYTKEKSSPKFLATSIILKNAQKHRTLGNNLPSFVPLPQTSLLS